MPALADVLPTLNVLIDAVDAIARWLFQWLCHQEAGRMLHFGSHSLGLCPRCLGMHTAFFLAAVASPVFFRKRFGGWMIACFALLGTAAGAHWLLEAEFGLASSGGIRFLTGAMSGIGGGMLFTVYRARRSFPVLLPSRRWSTLALLSAAAVLPVAILLSAVAVFPFGMQLLPDFTRTLFLLITGLSLIAVLGNAAMILSTFHAMVFSRFPFPYTSLSMESHHETPRESSHR